MKLRRGFTLTELLIVIMIIGIMSGLALSAISAAAELAREQRTRAIIAKLDSLLMERYEGYRTRAVPVPTATRQATTNPRVAAQNRLIGIRDLMRLEMPDRIADLCNTAELTDLQADNQLNTVNSTAQAQAAMLTSIPATARSYKRKIANALNGKDTNPATGWTIQYQGSECLYLIVSSMYDGDKSALDYFAPEEIGDLDDDGMKEILDGWGQPIEFLRWAPGYVTNPWDPALGPMLTNQTRPLIDASGNLSVYTPDIFDPAKCDPRVLPADTDITNDPFELRPLLISGGRDRTVDIILEDYDTAMLRPLVYRAQPIPNDPWVVLPYAGRRIGEPMVGSTGYADNLTNHYMAEL